MTKSCSLSNNGRLRCCRPRTGGFESTLDKARQTRVVSLSDASSASEAAMGVTVLEPVGRGCNEGNQPEQGTGQVDPHGVLHAPDAADTLGVLMNVELHDAQVSNVLVVTQRSPPHGLWPRTLPKMPNRVIHSTKRMKFQTTTPRPATRKTNGIK